MNTKWHWDFLLSRWWMWKKIKENSLHVDSWLQNYPISWFVWKIPWGVTKTSIIQVRYFGWLISDEFILHEQVHGMSSHQTFPHLITTRQELKYWNHKRGFRNWWKRTIKSCGLVLHGKHESFHHPTWHSVPSIHSLRKTVWLPYRKRNRPYRPIIHSYVATICASGWTLEVRSGHGVLCFGNSHLYKGRVFTSLHIGEWVWGWHDIFILILWKALPDHYFKLKRGHPLCASVLLKIVGIKKGSRPQLIIITIRKWTFRESFCATFLRILP